MTPAAMTPAAKRKGRSAGHRTEGRRHATPKAPRRVSGPVTPRSSAGRPRSHARRQQFRFAPVSGLKLVQAPSAARLRDIVDSLLDRAIRGRVWIPLLGVMLVGIVAMQVEVLKFGSSIGRSLQRVTALQSRNEQLRSSVASLADDQRIERLAAKQGMVMPPPDGIGFLSSHSGAQLGRAISNIHAPDPASFVSLVSQNGAVTGSSTSSASSINSPSGSSSSLPRSSGSTSSTASTGSTSLATSTYSTSSSSSGSASSSGSSTSSTSSTGG